MKLLVLGAIAGWFAGCATGILWSVFYAKGMRVGKHHRDE